MKVPDPQDTPRLYTIPPSAPFLTTLARALLSGDLPLPGGAKPDPLTLPLTTIYLPTRRAARALREAFLAESGGKALLLPRIHALGHADEDAALIFGAEDMEDADGALGRTGHRAAATAARADAVDPRVEPGAGARRDRGGNRVRSAGRTAQARLRALQPISPG